MDRQERWYADNLPLRGQVIADAGANVGRLSQFFWEASGGTSRVVSIEPLAENVAQIRARIAAAGADRWTVEACAVSARRGTLGLAVFQPPRGGLNSTAVKEKAARTVPCRPLSAIVPDATVVKLDIEGHEYEVLEDAVPGMAGIRAWAIELHRVRGRPLQPVLGLLMGHGYRVYAGSRDPADPDGPWRSAEIPATLDWDDVPAMRRRGDGSEFKMLHLIALREAA